MKSCVYLCKKIPIILMVSNFYIWELNKYQMIIRLTKKSQNCSWYIGFGAKSIHKLSLKGIYHFILSKNTNEQPDTNRKKTKVARFIGFD